MLKKIFFLCMSGVIFNSAALSANFQDAEPSKIIDHIHAPVQRITRKEVAGIYQFSGFSNSLDEPDAIGEPQSQAVVGQLQFFRNGNGTIRFADLTRVIDGQIVHTRFENVPFSYTLGSDNGYATAVVSDFPIAGASATFAISFKMRDGHVLGLSLLIIDTTTPVGRWTLLQGKRFN